MFTKQEASQLRKEFWTAFGKYMQPIPSFNGENCNWINYKTGVKNIRFHLDADDEQAIAAIELSHKNEEQRKEVQKKFEILRDDLNKFPGKWFWIENAERNALQYKTVLSSVHVLRKSDWPQIITFLKSAMIALDNFWVNNREIFEINEQ